MALLRMALVMAIMLAIYSVLYVLFYRKYRLLDKDVEKMTADNFTLSTHRSLKMYFLLITINCFCYSLVKVDPSSVFMDQINYVFTFLYLLIIVITFHMLRWSVIVKGDEVTINRTFLKKISFKFSDIEKIERPSADVLITLKSGEEITIFGKSKGFKFMAERLDIKN